jgi:uncharacterized protein (TIGR02452 family)
MTKYHSIRFVLDIAYEDHNKLHDKEQDWGKWFKYIIKMFDNNIPIALLKGLETKNNTHLSRCLDSYDSSIFTVKKERKEKKVADEYNSWIRRRDYGNNRAELEKEPKDRKAFEKEVIHWRIYDEIYRNKMQKEEIIWREYDELYLNEMQTVWETKLQKIINDRADMIQTEWFSSNFQEWEYTKRIFAKYEPLIPASKVFHVHENLSLCNDKKTCIQVVKSDTLEEAVKMKNPLVLIFADADRPGGCVAAGAGMQEESLFRRSALHKHLLEEMYPIEEDACIYAPDVPLVDLPGKTLCFIACPGIKMPSLDKGNTCFYDEDELLFRKKVELICQVACRHGHTDLVLGALGCGVWGGPPRHASEIFKSVLQKYEFENVTFAVLGANYNIFKDVLCD